MFDPDYPVELVIPVVLIVVALVLIGGAGSLAVMTWAGDWLAWVVGS